MDNEIHQESFGVPKEELFKMAKVEVEEVKDPIHIVLLKDIEGFKAGQIIIFPKDELSLIEKNRYGRLAVDDDFRKYNTKTLENKKDKTSAEKKTLISWRRLVKKIYDEEDREKLMIGVRESEERNKLCEDYIMALGESAEERNLKVAWKSGDEKTINECLKHLMLVALLWKSKNLPLYNSAIECMVRVIEKRIKIYTWRSDVCPELWVYVNGQYTDNGKNRLQVEIRNILGEDFSVQLETKIIERIMRDTFIDMYEFMDRCTNHHYEINVKNGIIKIDPETYKITLCEHTPENMFLYKLDVDYIEGVDCPIIDNFLKEGLAVDSDRFTFYEVTGTTLEPSEITKKGAFFYGPKNTGKSTTTNLLNKFFGKVNCENLSLVQLLEKEFDKSGLFGKLANIGGDISKNALKNPETFKMLTGGDIFSGNRKFKNNIKFPNQAKMFFNLNELPRIYGTDNAFWERILIFKYSKIFYTQSNYDKLTDKSLAGVKDGELIDKMTTPTELTGLLNKALEGLIRYYKTGGFSYVKGCDEVKDEWMRTSDSFLAFCFDNIEVGDPDSGYIEKKDIAKKYHRYCITHGVHSVGDKGMKATLSSEYGVYVDGRTQLSRARGDAHGSYDKIDIWEGIKWKNKTLCDNNKLLEDKNNNI